MPPIQRRTITTGLLIAVATPMLWAHALNHHQHKGLTS
jgi:hypothetical protein